jgi:hypothetical protein
MCARAICHQPSAHEGFFLYIFNTFSRAKVRGAAKTRWRAICIDAARSVTSDNGFHVEIFIAPLSLAR